MLKVDKETRLEVPDTLCVSKIEKYNFGLTANFLMATDAMYAKRA